MLPISEKFNTLQKDSKQNHIIRRYGWIASDPTNTLDKIKGHKTNKL